MAKESPKERGYIKKSVKGLIRSKYVPTSYAARYMAMPC
jgi:hypothetical protein